ncbi:hypothetical protein C5L14_16670 [Labrys okinawensis]|uniref:Uncharacterized protein n=1 Tax=Labrys okinawensis TaxID=346911 RepID=A0A2S9QC45_9HYPH|nr:hypothetical protein [Labrys okinawensis]PRH86919.1 hypothetical protein C5L14_16670 [Labrys okinawensis]
MTTSFSLPPIDAALADGTPAQIVGVHISSGAPQFVCMRLAADGKVTLSLEATVTGIEIETGAAADE